MKKEGVNNIIQALIQIEQDSCVPKNIREKVKCAYLALQDENCKDLYVKIDKSLQELEEISEIPNTPQHTRAQIWNVVSLLEVFKKP